MTTATTTTIIRRLRFSSDADIVRLTNARIIIIIIIIAVDPPSVIDYNGTPLCGEYPMAGNLTRLTQAAVRSVTTVLKSRLRNH